MDRLTHWGRNIAMSLLAGLALVYGIIWVSGRGSSSTLVVAAVSAALALVLVVWARFQPGEE